MVFLVFFVIHFCYLWLIIMLQEGESYVNILWVIWTWIKNKVVYSNKWNWKIYKDFNYNIIFNDN